MKRAQEMGYTKTIAEEFQKQNLPPQFFYLAMQESDFNEVASGPPTAHGHRQGHVAVHSGHGQALRAARSGRWRRFAGPIPATIGIKWEKATARPRRYIKDIYSTDAQASGLLVMASLQLGRAAASSTCCAAMPANPQGAQFLEGARAASRPGARRKPTTTCCTIVSAAVIGENPKLFGFAFDSPLGATANP